MHPALQGLMTIVIGVGVCVAYYALSNQFLDKVLFPGKGPNAGRNINRANLIRPWLFLFPALFALGLYLAYPVYETLRLSLTERVPGGGYVWVGADNYTQMMGEPKFWEAMRNNMLWLLFVPAMSTAFGLLAAQLTDRIRWGNLAKSLIFMPMAISFVGASVIWKLVYDTRPADQDQIGILNAVYMALGGAEPQTWLTIPIWNNFFLMIVLVWIQTGFAMVILSAAITFDVNLFTQTPGQPNGVDIHGYEGNGVAEIADATRTGSLIGASDGVNNTGPHDVSLAPDFIQQLLETGDTLGLIAIGQALQQFGFVSLEGAGILGDAPRLSIEYNTYLPGDLNADGLVGIADLNLVLSSWNQAVPPANAFADPSGDGFVGIDDLNHVLANWNSGGVPPNHAASIPEPGTLALMGIAAMSGLARSKQRPRDHR